MRKIFALEGNHRAKHTELLVNDLLNAYINGSHMYLKVHIHCYHISYCPSKFGAMSHEQNERFHQDEKASETVVDT